MSTLTLWRRHDPFAEFDEMVRRAFGPVPSWPTQGRSGRPAPLRPAAEVSRDGDDAIVRVELPGVDVDNDVTVEIVDRTLVVRGERRDERAEQREGRSVREVRYGSFRRGFSLPAHVTAEALTATYDAGVLTVRVSGAYAGTGATRIPVSTGSVPAVDALQDGPDERSGPDEQTV